MIKSKLLGFGVAPLERKHVHLRKVSVGLGVCFFHIPQKILQS